MVLSDLPVFREITQSRAVYFDHHDTDSMVAAIDKVMTSSSVRALQIIYGYERVKEFNFKNLAIQLANIYKMHSRE